MIIVDKTGEFKKLQKFDQQISKKGRKLLSKKEKLSLKNRSDELMQECKRFCDDKFTAELLIFELISHLLQFYYAINQIWWPGFKKVIPDLRKREPSITKLIEKVIEEKNINSKIYLIDRLIKKII